MQCLSVRKSYLLIVFCDSWSGTHRIDYGPLFLHFLARDSMLSALYAIARPSVRLSVCLSVCLSVTRVDQSKTVELRGMQFSPYSSPIHLVFAA